MGTLTETFEAIDLAKRKLSAVVSTAPVKRNNFIADLVVALETGQIKTGSMSRSDRSPSTTSCCASRTISMKRLRMPAGVRSRTVSSNDTTVQGHREVLFFIDDEDEDRLCYALRIRTGMKDG